MNPEGERRVAWMIASKIELGIEREESNEKELRRDWTIRAKDTASSEDDSIWALRIDDEKDRKQDRKPKARWTRIIVV